MRRFHYGLFLAAIVLPVSAAAQSGQPQIPGTPAEMYSAWCAKCHADDGTGRVPVATVKNTPRDFTNCKLATSEPDTDWELVIGRGGPVAGMSSEMPAFGDLLTPEQLTAMVAYLHGFCKEPGWPSGNLNFPRPLFVEKAFPEDEVIVTPVISHSSGEKTGVEIEAVYERRIGRRANVEIFVPLNSVGTEDGRSTGLGDMAVAGKYVLHTNRAATQIVSGGLEVAFPTGRESEGLGGGVAVFSPFLLAGAAFDLTFVQAHLEWGFPSTDPWANQELVYRVYLGRSLDPSPSAWTFGIEMDGVDKEVALTPQMRKALTRTGALAAAFGVQIPIINRSSQPTARYVGYLLWEYLNPVRPRP